MRFLIGVWWCCVSATAGAQPFGAVPYEVRGQYEWEVHNLEDQSPGDPAPPAVGRLTWEGTLWVQELVVRGDPGAGGPGGPPPRPAVVQLDLSRLELESGRPPFEERQVRLELARFEEPELVERFRQWVVTYHPRLEPADSAANDFEALALLLALADGERFEIDLAVEPWSPETSLNDVGRLLRRVAPPWPERADRPAVDGQEIAVFELGPGVYLPEASRLAGLLAVTLKLQVIHAVDGDEPGEVPAAQRVVRLTQVDDDVADAAPLLSLPVVLGWLPTPDRYFTNPRPWLSRTWYDELTDSQKLALGLPLEWVDPPAWLVDLQRRLAREAQRAEDGWLISRSEAGRVPPPRSGMPAAVRRSLTPVQRAAYLEEALARQWLRTRLDPANDPLRTALQAGGPGEVWLMAQRAIDHEVRDLSELSIDGDPPTMRVSVTTTVPSSPMARAHPLIGFELRQPLEAGLLRPRVRLEGRVQLEAGRRP